MKKINILESKLHLLLTEAESSDIKEKVLKYLNYSELGKKDPMFSIEASKLHDELMYSLGLYHEEEEDRRAFINILKYIRILKRRRNIKSIIANQYDYWTIFFDDSDQEVCIDSFDAKDPNGLLDEPYKYGIAFKANINDGIDFLEFSDDSDKAHAYSYVTKARMKDEMRQKIYDMGLVPALLVEGSYHENFVFCVGVLPEFVSSMKKDSDWHDVFFECKFGF